MTRTGRTPGVSRLVAAIVLAAGVATLTPAISDAHGPDPALSGTFSQDEVLRFRWRAGSERAPTASGLIGMGPSLSGPLSLPRLGPALPPRPACQPRSRQVSS